MTNMAPATYPALTVCTNLAWATGLKITAAKSVISMRMVSGLKIDPTGFCIQPLAIRIHSAEKLVPKATSQVTARWLTLDIRFQPKKNRPTKVASRKKAISPSSASGAPKMSPT
ncbi:hypothetical protein D9M68_490570 [compost metagenome]